MPLDRTLGDDDCARAKHLDSDLYTFYLWEVGNWFFMFAVTSVTQEARTCCMARALHVALKILSVRRTAITAFCRQISAHAANMTCALPLLVTKSTEASTRPPQPDSRAYAPAGGAVDHQHFRAFFEEHAAYCGERHAQTGSD